MSNPKTLATHAPKDETSKPPSKGKLNKVAPKTIGELIKEQSEFMNSAIATYRIPDFSKFENKLPAFPSMPLSQDHPDGTKAFSVKFNTQSSRSLPSDAWGCVHIENGSEIPSAFSAESTGFPVGSKQPAYYKITNLSFIASACLQIVDFNSSRWSSDWNEFQTIIVGKGNISVPERKYSVLAHEMDHFLSYFNFWKRMCVKIFIAVNQTYPTKTACDAAIEELQYNNLINHLNARRKSAAFDSYPRGVPQCGHRYEKFKYEVNETFQWIQSSMIDENAWNEVVRSKRPQRLSEDYATLLRSTISKDKIKQKAESIFSENGLTALQAEWQKLSNTASVR